MGRKKKSDKTKTGSKNPGRDIITPDMRRRSNAKIDNDEFAPSKSQSTAGTESDAPSSSTDEFSPPPPLEAKNSSIEDSEAITLPERFGADDLSSQDENTDTCPSSSDIESGEKNTDTDESATFFQRVVRCCCSSFFCCCRNQPSNSRRQIANRRRRSPDEQALYQWNCSREDRLNGWSAFGHLPLTATGILGDRYFVPQESSAVPVFAILTTGHSMMTIGANLYFLCCQGEHSAGNKWALFTNLVITPMAFALFILSLLTVGFEAEHDDQDTTLLFFSIFTNCLIAIIFLLETGDLGFFTHNQINRNNSNVDRGPTAGITD